MTPTMETPIGTEVEELVEIGEIGRKGTIVGYRGQRLIVHFEGEKQNRYMYPECLFTWYEEGEDQPE